MEMALLRILKRFQPREKLNRVVMKVTTKKSMENIKDWLKKNYKQVIIVLVVCALGLFIINQWLSFQFKVELLSSPCQLCKEMGYKCQKYIPIILNWSP